MAENERLQRELNEARLQLASNPVSELNNLFVDQPLDSEQEVVNYTWEEAESKIKLAFESYNTYKVSHVLTQSVCCLNSGISSDQLKRFLNYYL